MKWTKTRPTKPGLYIAMVHSGKREFMQLVEIDGELCDSVREWNIDAWCWAIEWWFGPIPSPEIENE